MAPTICACTDPSTCTPWHRGILGCVTWSGAAVIEPGRLIYSGQLGVAHMHGHAAVQIVAITAGAAEFIDAAGRRAQGIAGVIPAGAAHALHAGTATGLMIYLEPTSAAGRKLAALFTPSTREDARAWLAAARQVANPTQQCQLSVAANAVLEQLCCTGSAAAHPDAPHSSVREAIDLLPKLLCGPVKLTDVARAVHISADRLGRLFARDVGLSFPAYVRWARLIRTMEVARGGGTLTDAAHAAGFSDSSHVNRAFHEMFGIAPSAAHRSVRLQ